MAQQLTNSSNYRLLHGLRARRCSISPHLTTRWVPGSLDWLWCPGLSPPFSSPLHVSVFFHSLLFTYHWISVVFLLYDWCSCTHRSTPHLLTFLVSYLARGWLSHPTLGFQRRSKGPQEAEISFQISALAGVCTSVLAVLWPQTLSLDYSAPCY